MSPVFSRSSFCSSLLRFVWLVGGCRFLSPMCSVSGVFLGRTLERTDPESSHRSWWSLATWGSGRCFFNKPSVSGASDLAGGFCSACHGGGMTKLMVGSAALGKIDRRGGLAKRQVCACSSSTSRREALREAVLSACRFHPFLRRWLEVAGWRVTAVKWFVPDGGRRAPVVWGQGLDRVSIFSLEVLVAISVDYYVISSLLGPLLRIVLSPCI